MKKQIKSLSSIAAVTGLCLAFSFSASAQSTTTGNTYASGRFLGWGTTSGNLEFRVNNLPKVVLQNTTGNFGIGVTSPTSILHTVASGGKTASYTANLFANTCTSTTSSITKYGVDIQSTGAWSGTSAVNVGLNVNATGAPTNYAALFSGGNVGIGTTTPSQKLEVTGTTKATTDGVPFIIQSSSTGSLPNYISWRNSAGTPRGYLGYEASNENFYIETAANANLYFATNGAVQATISGAGKVGIGETSPSYPLVVKSATNTLAKFNAIGSGAQAPRIVLQSNGTDGPALYATNYFNNTVLDNLYGNFTQLATGGTVGLTLNAGNVGIGTTSPNAYINSNPSYYLGQISSANKFLTIDGASGTAPVVNLQNSMNETNDGKTIGGLIFSRYGTGSQADAHFNVAGIVAVQRNGNYPSGGALIGADLQFWVKGGGASYSAMVINNIGNVIIGTPPVPNAAYKLNVGGSVRANEVVVNTTGADFVFEDNYQLKKLEEVEAFVKQNKHLPEIAPASEMQNNGQGIGEMNTKLLQKVEELTLYLIEANKTIQNQNKRLEALEKASIKK